LPKFAVLTLFLLPVAGSSQTAWPAECKAQTSRNGSSLCISLALTSGKLVVSGSKLDLTGTLATGRAVAAELLSEATTAVAKLPPPFWAALDRDQRRAARGTDFQDAGSKSIRTFSGQWRDFAAAFLTWSVNQRTATSGENALSETGAIRPLTTIHFASALLFENFDGEMGVVVFRIADRFDPSPKTLEIALRDSSDANRRSQELRSWLKPLKGSMWCRKKIEARITAFYDGRNQKVEIVSVDPRNARIVLKEAGSSQ
jgi:hypothetical protein